MENILMVFCRRQKHYSSRTVATKLGVSVEVYCDLERGNILMNAKQARDLAKLYKTAYTHFFNAALQLDLLHTRTVLLTNMKLQIELLKLETGDHSATA